MMNLVKMELYKLRTSKLFLILAAVVFALNAAIAAVVPIVSRLLVPGVEMPPTNLSDAIANPFGVGLLMIPMFISVVSFLYLDFGGGYVKNIAGQVGSRDSYVLSKFVAIGVHNLAFLAVGVLAKIAGCAIAGQLAVDGAVFAGVMTLLLKWLLSMAISAILLFLTVGVRNKTISSIVAVIFATGSLSLLYLGINTGISNLFKTDSVDVAAFMPDSLMNSVSVIQNQLVVNGVIVAAVFIVLFVILTCVTFKKRDVK